VNYDVPPGYPWLVLSCPMEFIGDAVDFIPMCEPDDLRNLVKLIDWLEAHGDAAARPDLLVKRALIREFLED
jgi:hypothetical protein